MTTLIKKRVSELEGAQLDWAVAKSLGIRTKEAVVEVKHPFVSYSQFCDTKKRFVICRRYSSDWSQGGPIIERELIELIAPSAGSFNGKPFPWRARLEWRENYPEEGPTPLIAAMRAFVVSRLGDEVEVPE